MPPEDDEIIGQSGYNTVATLNYILNNPTIASLMDSIGFNLTAADHTPVDTEHIKEIINSPGFKAQYMSGDEFEDYWWEGAGGLTAGDKIYIKEDVGDTYRSGPEHVLMHELYHLGGVGTGLVGADHVTREKDRLGFIGDSRNIEAYESGEFIGPDPSLGIDEYEEEWHEMHKGTRKGTVGGSVWEGTSRDLHYARPRSTDDMKDFYETHGVQWNRDSIWADLGRQAYGEDFIQGAHMPFGDTQTHYQNNIEILMERLDQLNLLDTLRTIYDERR